MKHHFGHLHTLMQQLNQVEDGLKALRDQVDTPTKPAINASIMAAQAMRDSLWRVDKALEREVGAASLNKAPAPLKSKAV